MLPNLNESWARDFLRRKEDTCDTVPRRKLEKERQEVSPEDVEKYYGKLKGLFEKHNYDPSLVANFDETMLEFGEKARRAVVSKNEELNFGYVAVQKPLMHITLCANIFGDFTSSRPFMIIPG